MTPRVHVVDVKTGVGDPFYLTPIFDAHLDDELCDFSALKRMADKRRDLPNHYVIWCGDFSNLVLPPDVKRFRPSVQPEGIARRDDWLNTTTDYVIKHIEELNLNNIFFSPGNHEDSAIKFHGYDLTSVVAHHFNAARGGYSGVIDFRVYVSKTQKITFRVVYAHGSWGGRLAKGYNSAHPFFSQIDSWNVALYGHCHALRHDPEVRRRVHEGHLESYEVHFINCGQWVESYQDDASVTYYAERAGHQPQPKKCPLIKITPRKTYTGSGKGKTEKLWLDVSVEV